MGLLTAIRDGKYDNDLDRISNAIVMRRRVLAAEKFYEISIGDRVRFVDWTRPSYLAGQPGTVVGKKVKKLMVRLDSPVGRFHGDIRCTPSLVELVGEGGSGEN